MCQYVTGQTEAPADGNKSLKSTQGGRKVSEFVYRKLSLMPGCHRLIISVKPREMLLNVNIKKKVIMLVMEHTVATCHKKTLKRA